MKTVQEIKRAIESLSLADREKIEDWVHTLGLAGHRVEERAAIYAVTRDFVSVETYLEQEQLSEIRHEYINGTLYAMSGASEAHVLITGNLFASIHGKVRGKPCNAYIVDFKVHIKIDDGNIFYYPDIMVACTREGVEPHSLRYPKLVVEVLSPSTESIDRREKFLSYKQIPTLEEYALLSQKAMELTIHRRANQWRPQVVSGSEASAEFRSIDLTLPLSQIYEGLSL